jgi:hypothetical protein
MAKQLVAKPAIAPGVGLEKSRTTSGPDRFDPLPFDQRSMQAHQLPHPSSGMHGFGHAGAIQIDDEHFGLATEFSDEEVAEVKVAMTSARVVETPDRGARRRCCSKHATVIRG